MGRRAEARPDHAAMSTRLPRYLPLLAIVISVMTGTPARLGLLGLFLALAAACGHAPGPAEPRVVELGADQAGQTGQGRGGGHVRMTLQDQFPVPGSSLVWRVSSSPDGILTLESESGPSPQQGLRASD